MTSGRDPKYRVLPLWALHSAAAKYLLHGGSPGPGYRRFTFGSLSHLRPGSAAPAASLASCCPLRPCSGLHKYGLLLHLCLDLFSSSSTQHRLLPSAIVLIYSLRSSSYIYSFSNPPPRRIFNLLHSSCLTLLMVVSSRTSSPEISPATMSSLLKPRNSLPLPLLSVRSVILSSSLTVDSLPWRAS